MYSHQRREIQIRFNPRPREGATDQEEAADTIRIVSIHAPVKGRPSKEQLKMQLQLFQSTPP